MERLVKTLTFKIGEETRPVKLNKDSYKDNLLSAQISKALGLIEEFFPSDKTTIRDDLDDIPANKTISFLGERYGEIFMPKIVGKHTHRKEKRYMSAGNH